MYNTSQIIKKVIISSTISLGLIMSASISAASISTFRIYLDKEQTTDNFLIFSKDEYTENCNIKLRHFDFDNTGIMSQHNGDNLPDNSANNWIRYTPRSFELSPMGQQTVRFSLRRKANSSPMEYRSYVSIQCMRAEPKETLLNTIGNTNTATIGVTPRLVQNVPIVVRNGKLDASLTFSDLEYNDGKLTFNLNRTGNRSVYGRLSLINKKSGDEITFTDGISLYTETAYSSFDFNTKLPLSDLSLKFVEDKKYGGSIELIHDISL